MRSVQSTDVEAHKFANHREGDIKFQRLLQGDPDAPNNFELSIYFGRNLAQRYDRLCQALFNHFPAPLLRASFVLADEWRLASLRSIAFSEIQESHRDFVIQRARSFFERRQMMIEFPSYSPANTRRMVARRQPSTRLS